MASKKEGFYKLGSGLEKAVAYYTTTDFRFGNHLLEHIATKGFSNPTARLLVDAAKQIYLSKKMAPASARIVFAQINTMIEKGQVTEAQLKSARSLIVSLCDDPPPETAEQIKDILVTKLKRHAQKDAIDQLNKDYVKGGDLDAAKSKLEKADQIGHADVSVGTRIYSSLISEILKRKNRSHCATGIAELDLLIHGLRAQSLGCFVADSGVGKSMALIHSMAANAARGYNCALATIGELSWEEQYLRIISNLTGVAMDDLCAEDDQYVKEADEILTKIIDQFGIGLITVKEFPDGVTVAELREWLKTEVSDRPIHVLYVDYADKMGWRRETREGGSTYEGMKQVYSGLRGLVREPHFRGVLQWVWTASQLRADGLEASDSKWKKRIVDLMIKIAPEPNSEGEELRFSVVKNRHGVSSIEAAAVPHDFERARMCPPNWPVGWPV